MSLHPAPQIFLLSLEGPCVPWCAPFLSALAASQEIVTRVQEPILAISALRRLCLLQGDWSLAPGEASGWLESEQVIRGMETSGASSRAGLYSPLVSGMLTDQGVSNHEQQKKVHLQSYRQVHHVACRADTASMALNGVWCVHWSLLIKYHSLIDM